MQLVSNPWQKLSLYIGKATHFLYYPFDQGKKETVYKISGNIKFKLRVNTADKFTVWETWKLDSYKSKELDIRSTDIVIDLGAHIGAFSVYAACKAAKGKVFAYEPEPENFRLLKENKELNGLDNLYLFQQGVMDKPGEIKLFVEHSVTSINTIFETDNKLLAQAITVSATTLEDIITDNKLTEVDFLKIDIEGAEYTVLLNAPAHIFEKIKRISLEYHDHLNHGHNVKELEEFLQSFGFKTKIDGTFFMRKILRVGLLKAWKI